MKPNPVEPIRQMAEPVVLWFGIYTGVDMPAILSQLMPFNQHRLDAVIALMAWKSKITLTQYEVVKLHVLTDVFHVLECGQPVIGGELQAWPNGPVVREAYTHIMEMARGCAPVESDAEYFRIDKTTDRRYLFTAKKGPDDDEFSESELKSMRLAWKTLRSLDGKVEREKYFHKESFLGRAHAKAIERAGSPKARNVQMSWEDVIDEYAKEFHVDADRIAYLKLAIRA